jgi:hypothetical protein
VAASRSDYMPLHGAILISNPRKSPMASAKSNPVRGIKNLIARQVTFELQGKKGARSNPANAAHARRYNYASKAQIRAAIAPYMAQWSRERGLPVSQRTGIFAQKPKGQRGESLARAMAGATPTPTERALRTSVQGQVASAMRQAYGVDGKPAKRGFVKRNFISAKGKRYKSGKKRQTVAARGAIAEHQGRNVPGMRAANAKRVGIRNDLAYFDQATHQYTGGPISWKKGRPGASGMVLMSLGADPNAKPKSRRKSKKGSKAFSKVPGITALKKSDKWASLSKEQKSRFNAAYKQGRSTEMTSQEAVAYAWKAKANPSYGALALDNYGALALDNYGALALDNPVPFAAAGAAVSAGKFVLVGLAGALGHAAVADKVEDVLVKIPVVGEKLLDLTVPEFVPLVGGMELDNTVTGTIAGAALIAISQFVGRKFNQPMITTYGSALGTGILIAGPILDYGSMDSMDDDEDEGADEAGDIAGLALENYGGVYEEDLGALALDNEGTFGDAYGDGMAYQLGAIAEDTGDDYGQSSLGDAYYSGADFDLGEGQALVNGRMAFHRRFGRPSRRIHRMGGTRGGASHLASKPGHRWGWLIKMLGWANVQKLAAMRPRERVIVIKKLRGNALDTFSQLQTQAQAQVAAAPELAPISAQGAGADGVGGVFGAYGATVFGGAGL